MPDNQKRIAIPDIATADVPDREWLVDLASEAEKFLDSFRWCGRILKGYLDRYEDGIFALFLFEIEPAVQDADPAVWIMVGDLPPAYLDTLSNANGGEAIETYVIAMREWVDAVDAGKPVSELIPMYNRNSNTEVVPSAWYADLLRRRLDFLEQEVVPMYADELRPR